MFLNKSKELVIFFLLALVLIAILIGSKPTSAQNETSREIDVSDIEIPEAYAIEAYVANLSVPTTAIFDGEDLLVAESGYNNTAKPRVLRISRDGTVRVEAKEGLEPPLTGLLVVDGILYISHRGKVSIVQNGILMDIVSDLPSEGDHQNNQIVLGSDGKIYMGQGTRTNSGVVGVDNFIFGWLSDYPNIHEIPCKDIILRGNSYETKNPLTEEGETVQTGPYKPFGTPAQEDETIQGSNKCGGSIVRFNPDGSEFEVVAWGLRNPFGLAFDESGQLWATYHGVDVRGSRPVYSDPDYLVQVEEGAWYGWPEYFDSEPVTSQRFDPPAEPAPDFIWQDHPELTEPYMTFEPHTAVNGIAFSPGETFGHDGDLFIAMFGSLAPLTTGLEIEGSGFKVVRVDISERSTSDFATNLILGPAYINQTGGMDRPSDVVFGADEALYIADWGGTTADEEGLKFQPETGVVWRVYNTQNQEALRPNGPIIVESAAIPAEERKPAVPNIVETYEAIASQGVVALGILGVFAVLIFVIYRIVKRKIRI